MAKMDASNLKRLKEEQERALIETDNQLDQWNQFRSDYVALRDRLNTLPNKTTHNVMVPFGSLAFMPGQLVHTNEILVLLGDNYFVERSGTQAADIVTRRLKKMDENIHAIQKQREMLTPRAQFTSEMIQTAMGEGEQKEIVEEYDEEQERRWRERHREYLRRAGEKQMKGKAKKETTKEAEMKKTDADYWDILDQLEEQETRRRELDGMKEEQFEDPQQDGSSSLEDSEETEEEEDSSDDEEEEDCKVDPSRIITFSHTKQQDDALCTDSVAETKDSTDINSPADLYRFVKTAPKSILKATSKRTAIPSRRGRGPSQEEQEKKVTFDREYPGERKEHGFNMFWGEKEAVGARHAAGKETQVQNASHEPHVQAFSDTVVERATPAVCVQQPRNNNSTSGSLSKPEDGGTSSRGGTLSKPEDGGTSSRPVSKFRASRQQKCEKTETVPQDSQQQVDSGVSGAAAMQQPDVASARPVSKFRASRMKQGGGS